MDAGEPKFRRRKADRPAEIVAAAMAVFAEKGFAAAKLDEIARRAGVSKGALYLYFETKEDLFRAVVAQAVAPNIEAVEAAVERFEGDFASLLRLFAANMARLSTTLPLGGVAKMIIGESRNFPELARIWHDALVEKALAVFSGAIARAQAKGEVRAGDPRAFALGVIGPLLMSVLWNEVFAPVGAAPFDTPALMAQHVETALGGMLATEPAP
jgi:AcrR family transcriptional regulator